MIKIGIDFSLTSPGICVFKDNDYHFISLFDTSSVKDWEKSKKFETHRKLSTSLQIIPYRRIDQPSDYNLSERLKLTNARVLADRMVIILADIIEDDDVIIGLEGFSFGSKSNSYIDLVMYQTILRDRLVEEFGDILVILSPSQIKKSFTGKGNANKDQMLEAFKECDDDILHNTKLYQYCKSLNKTEKPIDDLCDSYAIMKCL